MVTCKLCEAQFRGEGTQGHGCAASVFQKDGESFVLGHYGSRLFDMSLYKFVPAPYPDHEKWQPTPTEPVDPVCDVCIQVWKDLDKLVLMDDQIL